jgi:anaerobic ribonucleoside-triphosphate reductase activating protein
MLLNLARTLRRSAANGPGERFVVWVQGCPLACPGCWNPDTWSFARREARQVDALIADILGVAGIEGVTFTGGEPFAQARALAAIAARVQVAGLSVVVFTGYEMDELDGADARSLLAHTDLLVAGRYVQGEREEGLPLRGSRNQRLHFLTGRYGPIDVLDAPDAEVHLSPDGAVTVTGFPCSSLLDSG